MKLLLDQNISFKLVPILDVAFPGSKHVSDFGLTGDDDEAIFAFIRAIRGQLFSALRVAFFVVSS